MALLNSKHHRAHSGFALRSLVALVLIGSAGIVSAQDELVSQVPLSAGGTVPSNVVLTPSVEYPTVNSKANIAAFASGTAYYGYFDPYKCYTYHYDALEANRYFEPSRSTGTTPALCDGVAKEWSGNWLNWAATQTIDGFRKALTGGLRVVDTSGETQLEKARHDGQGGFGYFPNGAVNSDVVTRAVIPTLGAGTAGAGNVARATQGWPSVIARINGLGNQMYITAGGTLGRVCAGTDVIGVAAVPTNSTASPVVDYNPTVHLLNRADTTSPVTNHDCDAGAPVVNRPNTFMNTIYRVSVRVKVCVSGLPEDNCIAYGSNAKPEGLVQKYERKMRFSVFGYLVDNNRWRDGGVLRASQKYVGPERLDTDSGLWVPNDNREWDPETGVFYPNPNPDDANDTTTAAASSPGFPVQNSGVINYINKFAQNANIGPKTFDPVSELYYTATRYLRNKGSPPRYHDLTRRMDNNGDGTVLGTAQERWRLTDNFPVISEWEDPFQFWCQNTAIIGIGDVYTHRDKNLAGRERDIDEPSAIGPAGTDEDFSGDGKQSVAWWTRQAYDVEGIDYPPMPLSNLENSAYMVGLSYFMHTQDIRVDLGPDNEKQFVSTHWVDVREEQRVEPRIRNQYWMAAKYGGFLMDEEYDALTNVDPLPAGSWEAADPTDTLTSNSVTYPNETFRRTSNYYRGDRPDTMVSSLTRAFAKFGAESKGSGASLAANSTRLDTQTLTFQAQFQNSIWLGQLKAFGVDQATGALSAEPVWTAGENMPVWSERTIFVNAVDEGDDNYQPFEWDNLSPAQQVALSTFWTDMPTGVDGADVVEYLKGNQSLEESPSSGPFRTRARPSTDGADWSPILGDIVNSTPVFVGSPNPALYAASPGTWEGKEDHNDFATAQANRRPMVWVGGNDGMLHGFDASVTDDGEAVAGESGVEVYAFIPAKAISTELINFANPDYEHKYFVDGDVAVADVWNGTAWRTVLVGTMGRGGPGLFALDVTNPDAVTFLWELDETDIPDLGHNIGRPVITQVADGDWRVVFGNGIDSVNGKANLITVGIFNGTPTSIELDAGDANGLTAVLVRDSNSDGIFDTAYAGDLEGTMWKVTNFTGDADDANAVALFHAVDDLGNEQPITAAPLVGRKPNTSETWVFFGTGKFLNEDDLVDTQQQTWYGIKDIGATVGRDTLVARAVLAEGVITGPDDDDEDTDPEVIFNVRTITEAEEGDMAGMNGWYMNLPTEKERMVVPNRFQGSALIGTTRIPDASDACRPTGRGFIMAIDPFSGARLEQTFFDANRDGVFDEADMLNGEIVSGLGLDSPANNPIFVGGVMLFTKDNADADSVKVQGSSAEARRASWREITN